MNSSKRGRGVYYGYLSCPSCFSHPRQIRVKRRWHTHLGIRRNWKFSLLRPLPDFGNRIALTFTDTCNLLCFNIPLSWKSLQVFCSFHELYITLSVMAQGYPEVWLAKHVLIRSHGETSSGIQIVATSLSSCSLLCLHIKPSEFAKSHRENPLLNHSFFNFNSFLPSYELMFPIAGPTPVIPQIIKIKHWIFKGKARSKKGSPTKRACGVGQKPGVYTADMKGVAAHREQPELILFRKLTETNRTVKWLLRPLYLPVLENRKSINKRLVHTRIMKMEKLLQLPLKRIRGCIFLVPIRFGRCWGRRVLHEKSNKQVEQARDEK